MPGRNFCLAFLSVAVYEDLVAWKNVDKVAGRKDIVSYKLAVV